MTKYLSDDSTLMVIGDNCYHYRNWLTNQKEGNEPEYPVGGFRTINHVDAFLNAHGYVVSKWMTVYGLPTSEDAKEEVINGAEKIGISWEQASAKAYVITSVKRN